MSIGHKIKKVRELKNYTQEHLAEKLNMSVTGYGKIERDEVDLPYSRLEQIAEVLQVPLGALVNFDEKIVFNNYGPTGSHSNVNFGYTINEVKLYEDKIKLLEEKNNLLQEKFDLMEKLNQKVHK